MRASVFTFVTILLFSSECVWAQNPEPQQPGRIQKIVALQGEGAINNIQSGTASEPVVEVRDERDVPIPNVDVTFQLPASGAGGFFPGRALTLRTKTNENGQAAGMGLIPNSISGRFQIHVTATSGSSTASLIINERNVANAAEAAQAAKVHPRSHTWTIIAIAGGAAATVGILFATHTINIGGGSSTPPNSLTVSAGPITIGSPH